jgi:hypothetical protein
MEEFLFLPRVALGRNGMALSYEMGNAQRRQPQGSGAIKKLDTHRGKSLQFVLSNCDKLPVLPALELAPVKVEANNGASARPASPPRKYRAMSSILDLPPQQLAVATASSSSPPPELVTPEPGPEIPVRADSHGREREYSASQTFMDIMAGAFEVVRRTEEDLHRVKDELREEKSQRAADVAQLNKELGAAKAEHMAQVAKISEKVEGLEAEKAESEATVRRLMAELKTEKTKHAAEVKALNDEWRRAQRHALAAPERCHHPRGAEGDLHRGVEDHSGPHGDKLPDHRTRDSDATSRVSSSTSRVASSSSAPSTGD